MCCHVVLVVTDVSEERIASIFRVKTISGLKTHKQYLATVALCQELIAICKRETIEWDVLHGGLERTLLQRCLIVFFITVDMSGHCFVTDVIERYLYGRLPQ
jgi:hypothetical protein